MTRSLRFLKGVITKIENQSKNANNLNVYTAQYYLDELEDAFKEFRDHISGLSEEEAFDLQQEFDKYELSYINAKSALSAEVDAKLHRPLDESVLNTRTRDKSLTEIFERQTEILTKMSTMVSTKGDEKFRLPRLKIPVFNGDFREWNRFKNLFRSKIHDVPGISDAEKLDHLLSLVSGEACSLIKNYAINDANYRTAWKVLHGHYEKPLLISDRLIGQLLDAPSVSADRSNLRSLYTTLTETLECLESMDSYYQSRDPWVIHLMSKKLDRETAESWARTCCEKGSISVPEFLEFLKERCDAMSMLSGSMQNKFEDKKKQSLRTMHAFVGKCFVCHGAHKIFQCDKFSQMSVVDRQSCVRRNKRCFNCLGSNHLVTACFSKSVCSHCRSKHHSLLHSMKPETSKLEKEIEHIKPISEGSNEPENMIKVNLSSGFCSPRSVIPTAVVHIHDQAGKAWDCRVLLDTGSQASFVSESFCSKLGLRRFREKVPVACLMASMTIYSRGCVNIVLQSRIKPDYKITITAHVLSEISGQLPSEDLKSKWTTYLNSRFPLADPNFDKSDNTEMILGSDVFFDVLGGSKYYLTDERLYIQESSLGWLVAGGSESADGFGILKSNHAQIGNDEESLGVVMERFWKLEEQLSGNEISEKEDDVICENIFRKKTIRLPDGRFSVDLPFNSNIDNLGDSRSLALNRFFSLEKKFALNSDFFEMYSRIIDDFKRKQFMEPVPHRDLEKLPNKVFYLPHYGVSRSKSRTMKLRIVFDASMKSIGGVSLNDALFTGPNIQNDLRSLLLTFRFDRYVLAADIIQMYRQIRINEYHRDYQRFFWRNSPSDPLEVFRLTTVMDGMSSSPFLALRAIDLLAEKEIQNYPLGAEVLRSRYMDDFYFGDESITGLLEKKSQLIGILKAGGMALSKWASNEPSAVGESTDDVNLDSVSLGDSYLKATKALGLKWNCHTDVLFFDFDQVGSSGYSKRALLSETSRIFDPLGFLSPIIVRLKILFQETWLRKLNWDDDLPDDILSAWESLKVELREGKRLEVGRWIEGRAVVELHGFSDASMKAYAGVVFLKSTDTSGKTVCNLLYAKTKVSPIKSVSVARLELCGAHLLASMLKMIVPLFRDNIAKVYCWCDSKIVLCWLRSHPSRWNTFVGNRCSHIHELIPQASWGYVRTDQNPADLATRGCSLDALKKSEKWWSGPRWLDIGEYPREFDDSDQTDMEKRKVVLSRIETLDSFWSRLENRFSSYSRLVHSVAYVLRVCAKMKRKPIFPEIDLSVEEVRDSTLILIRNLQRTHFSREHELLVRGREVRCDSSLRTLTPFVDGDGLIRVGGRLANSGYPYAKKHPIVLPRSNFVKLITIHVHRKYYHAGVNFVLSILKQHYYVPGMKEMVKTIVRSCTVCRRYRAATYDPIMGHLPSNRFDAQKAFDSTGVDFAGYFVIRPYRGRGNIGIKSYVAIFVCMFTRAIHLELVFGLSTESFICALKRFVGRKGRCTHLLSDNGTNFVGSNRVLMEVRKEVLKMSDSNEVKSFLLENLMDWSFLPAQSPHFGGIWESGVKSLKFHLIRLFRDQTPTVEEFGTALVEIEAILNSRPLIAVNNDPEESSVLTPSHLSVGHASAELPVLFSENPDNVGAKFLPRYRYVHANVKQFWREWRNDYFQHLLKIFKWNRKGSRPEMNDVVIIKRNNTPPGHWAMGRVVAVYPGVDEIVRVVDVKTTKGLKRESTRNLIPLLNHTDSMGEDVQDRIR